MKFGKLLQKRQLDIPEYAASFVNYKALKKLIKQLSATPTIPTQNEAQTAVRNPDEADLSGKPLDARAALQANKATFFFRLERELEKVNAFYLQKEAELQLRLRTLSDKKRVLQSRGATAPKTSARFIALEEGFQQFGSDLNKLQQFVDINATAFSKILKKWDKTSKSRTKELYLSRAVEVQPVFNRDVISSLSDQATNSLLELGAWAEGERSHWDTTPAADRIVPASAEENDSDAELLSAVTSGNLPLLREWTARLRNAPDASARWTRAFLTAITAAPDAALRLLLDTGQVDIQAEDDIHERNCLHEAATAGRAVILELGLQRGVDPMRCDVYGRIPLHYAAMHGHVDMVHTLLASASTAINFPDHDQFTPLIHAIVHDHLACVEALIAHGARLDTVNENEHAPLNLACQYGSLRIAKLLLSHRAAIVPDAEGLYPQHLVARKGANPAILLTLRDHGADLNQRDKLYQWTPLFHAASEGSEAAVETLLANGAEVDLLDEKGLSAMYYATWEGHLSCMQRLSAAAVASAVLTRGLGTSTARSSKGLTQRDGSAGQRDVAQDPDGIPELALPPPIIPLRRYGHNFLDTKAFIQITFEAGGVDPVLFYDGAQYPAARLTIASKASELIPRNVMLPLPDDFRSLAFQVDRLDAFTIDFDIFPTFGAARIARTVALPDVFRADMSSSGSCCLPLFDPRLRAIGQIRFTFQVIKPFIGIPMEIAQSQTYWKATSHLDADPHTWITGSSLSGDYVRLFVQLTADGIPVLCPHWQVRHHGLDVPVGRLSWTQLQEVALVPEDAQNSLRRAIAGLQPAELFDRLRRTALPLRAVLDQLDPNIHVNLHVLYPPATTERQLGLGSAFNINTFADAILSDVYDHARATREQHRLRSIVFSSFHADLCTALNWKQPSYPVLLCDHLGAADSSAEKPQGTSAWSDGPTSMSIKEAVRVAQANNLMGLVCTARILAMVPALAAAIKSAGLVLVADASEGESDGTRPFAVSTAAIAAGQADPMGDVAAAQGGIASHMARLSLPEGVDGVLHSNGVLRFHETVDM